MKKKTRSLLKRILILSLCTVILSNSVINKYKITANAAAMAFGTGVAYEVCYLIGEYFLVAVGAFAAGDVIYQNRDKIAEIGKEVIDSCSFDDAPDWVIHKATASGQQQVIGREVFDYIRTLTLVSVLAGGSSPQNNNDDDDDDDEPESTPDANPEENPDVTPEDTPTAKELYDARTAELDDTVLMPVGGFLAVLAGAFAPLIEDAQDGEENIVSEIFELDKTFSDFSKNSDGNYVIKGSFSNSGNTMTFMPDATSVYPVCAVVGSDMITFYYWYGSLCNCHINAPYKLGDSSGNSRDYKFSCDLSTLSLNVPLFSSKDAAISAFQYNDYSSALNYSKVYQIADWLQDDWSSALGTLHGGIHSLTARSAIIGEAANRAFQNQLDGKGYIEALDGAVASTTPLPLPGTLQDPVYVPEDSTAPKLDPSDFPWPVPETSPDLPGKNPSDDTITDEEIRGSDTFGLDTLFGILILLIMILIMLLLLFLSCLAFIIMIFRIPAQTGFLPEEMIAGLDYIKTLEILGFGMSVYDFFMSLIYILLIFSVIGVLRKNIDKLKFPRKGK